MCVSNSVISGSLRHCATAALSARRSRCARANSTDFLSDFEAAADFDHIAHASAHRLRKRSSTASSATSHSCRILAATFRNVSNATRTAGARFRDQTLRTYASTPRLSAAAAANAPRAHFISSFRASDASISRLNLLPCHGSSRDWPSPRVSGSTVHAAPLDWTWTLRLPGWRASRKTPPPGGRHRSVAPRRLRRAAASRSLRIFSAASEKARSLSCSLRLRHTSTYRSRSAASRRPCFARCAPTRTPTALSCNCNLVTSGFVGASSFSSGNSPDLRAPAASATST